MKYNTSPESATSVCELPPIRHHAEKPASEARSSRMSGPVNEAYEEYCRLLEAGEAPDRAEFCARYPDIEYELVRTISIHTHVLYDPEFYTEPFVNWPRTGESFLGFHLERELGRGAFSHVFLATEPALGNRSVVVKISRLGAAEALTLGRLEHANIAPVYSVVPGGNCGLAAVCMPYLGEATLNALLARLRKDGVPRRAQVILDAARTKSATASPPPSAGSAESEAVLRRSSYTAGVQHLARQMLEALAFIHARGVVHRDLKPSNVLLANGAVPMLLDFNLSGDVRRADVRFGGTPIYMSPEQLELMGTENADEALVDAKSDLFSLGVILYELLTGKHPFAPPGHGTSLAQTRRELLWNQQAGARPVRALNPSVERSMSDLIGRCLACAPEDRPESAAAALATLLPPSIAAPRSGGLKRAALALFLATALASGLVRNGRSSQGDAVLPDLEPGQNVAVVVPVSDLQRGQQALAEKDYESAVKHLGRHLLNHDRDADAWMARGLALLKLGARDPGKFALAAGALEEADRLRPDGSAKACLGYALQQCRRLPEARQCYEEAERAGRGSAGLLNNLGNIYLNSGKYGDAERCFDRALADAPALQAAYHNRGRLFLKQAKPSAPVAARTFRSAVTEQQFLRLALRDLSQAIELGPPSDELYRDAATVLVRLSKYDPELRDRAIGCLDLALQYGLEPNQLDREHFKNLSGHWWFDDLRKRPHTPNTAATTQCLVAISAE